MPCPYNFNIGVVFSVFSAPSVVNVLGQQRFDGLEQRFRVQYHAFTAAKRAVVHGAMAIMSEYSQVVHAHVRQASLARAPHDAVIERAGKKIRENSDDIKLHARHSVSKQEGLAANVRSDSN